MNYVVMVIVIVIIYYILRQLQVENFSLTDAWNSQVNTYKKLKQAVGLPTSKTHEHFGIQYQPVKKNLYNYGTGYGY